MGAWSEETFGNDTACDWAATFLEEPGLRAVEAALAAVLEEPEYLDSDQACEALAACEVLARWQGRWGTRDAYSEELDAWLTAHPQAVTPELRQRAAKAIDRILGEDSELPQLWDEGGRNEVWHARVDDLRARVLG